MLVVYWDSVREGHVAHMQHVTLMLCAWSWWICLVMCAVEKCKVTSHFSPHFTILYSYVVGLSRRRSLIWMSRFSSLAWFHWRVTVCTECAMYGVGCFMTKCWISHEIFLPQMCSVHCSRWNMLSIRWPRQNCEILIMVFGIKVNLFSYHNHYVTWNISAGWKFFFFGSWI